jgi:hypothetical protein
MLCWCKDNVKIVAKILGILGYSKDSSTCDEKVIGIQTMG